MDRILIADDEARIRHLIRKYAEFQGYEVAEASDGLEAVEMCRGQDFDVIVLDIMMPELDGFSACKEIRKTRDIPVIMLSARGEEYDKLYGFELGIDDYVGKPFSPKELMARIQAVTARYRSKSDETERDILALEWTDGGFYRKNGYRGRQADRHDAKGIRSALLPGEEPEYCPDQGKDSY